MNNDVSAPSVQAEGTTSLPPPRAFGETNTLTVPRSRRRRAGDDVVARLADAVGATHAAGHIHLAVVPADSTPITLTL
jgi:hypothetical protein